MRQITKQSINNFLLNNPFKSSNTRVEIVNNGAYLLLHGNNIAKKVEGKLLICDGGWQTRTTKERLNALPGVNIYQKNWQWYLNGQKWDGSWVEIQ